MIMRNVEGAGDENVVVRLGLVGVRSQAIQLHEQLLGSYNLHHVKNWQQK